MAKSPTHTPKEIIYHVVGTKRPLSPKLSAALKKTLKEALAPSSLQGYHKVTASVLESYAERKRNPNNSGGIQGGISNGENIVLRIGFKPTATIRKSQNTIDEDGNATTLEATGRHDPCVLPRAVPMVEAMVALVLADHLLRQKGQCSDYF